MLALRLVLAAQLVSTALAAASAKLTLLSRQTITPNDGCVSACSVVDDATTDSTLASLCTSAVVNGYATCYDCMVAANVVTQDTAQAAVDEYASTCTAAGYPVSSVTVSGGSSGTGTTGTAGSSHTTTTAAGASGTTTSSSSGSGSSSGSSSTSGDSDSNSSGSSSSSSGGGGIKGGGGFNLNDGVRVRPGLAVIVISVVSALVLRIL
ncbi:hypothetical protein C8R46DRAFT_1220974 [Mycena filopes]|nr:hypothetical protein C8R46DRAFT_1220974 [Mycena filopes]